jgi:uncharacterized glyoxalase superfamily protein PhnB
MRASLLFPLTITDKIDECKKFYIDYFDFKVIFENDWYAQLRSSSNNIEIGLMLPNLDNQPDFLQSAYNGKGMMFTFEVDDVQAEYDNLISLGVVFKMHIKDEEWGQRHFIVEDPAGVHIDVVQTL